MSDFLYDKEKTTIINVARDNHKSHWDGIVHTITFDYAVLCWAYKCDCAKYKWNDLIFK